MNIDINFIFDEDNPIDCFEYVEIGDVIADDKQCDPAEACSMSLLKERVSEVLETLSEREKQVINERFGLNDYPKTIEEVAKKYNVTRERIRQIEAKALKKLRHPTRMMRLQDFVE